MNAQTVSITEAARNFSDFVNRVAYRQESFFLIRGKKTVAELRPVPHGKRLSDLPALFQSLPLLNPREQEDLQNDLDQLRPRPR
ncbi:MAG: type II toxin-antitoxin system Phd/YefM family antitoxin [Blastochloris sp.]|nr:type II toxin-antitoxin system Phd/YefM family antitoxin [Blastochloris sp.]